MQNATAELIGLAGRGQDAFLCHGVSEICTRARSFVRKKIRAKCILGLKPDFQPARRQTSVACKIWLKTLFSRLHCFVQTKVGTKYGRTDDRDSFHAGGLHLEKR